MMRYYILLLFSMLTYGQQPNYNILDGFVIGGYDVVSYFSNMPTIGNNAYVYVYDNAIFRFSSQKNLDLFKNNPTKYTPQYGGWCAYAMALNGQKITIHPEYYEIRNDKLYLFYKTLINNTYKKWVKKNPKLLITKADNNWRKI